MTYKLDLIVQNAHPTAKRALNIDEGAARQALLGLLQAAFGREAGNLDVFSVTLTLRPEDHHPTIADEGVWVGNDRQRAAVLSSDYGDDDWYRDDEWVGYDETGHYFGPPIPPAPWKDPAWLFTRLVENARSVASDRPWDVLEDGQVFMLENQDGGDPLFVSVLGREGDEYGVSIFPGWKGCRYLMGKHAGTQGANEQKAVPAGMRVTFENRGDLPEEDYMFLLNLKCSFRGKKRWPLFRVQKPGGDTDRPDEREAEQLRDALTYVLKASKFAREGRVVPIPRRDDEILVIHMGDWPQPKPEYRPLSDMLESAGE